MNSIVDRRFACEKDDIIAARLLTTCRTANAILTSLGRGRAGRRRKSPTQKGDRSVRPSDSLFHCSLSGRTLS